MPEIPQTLQHEWIKAIRQKGYRLTQPLKCVVDVLAQTRRALSPAEVFAQGRKIYPRLGLVTVYRTLEKLEALGLVERIHHPSGCHMYLRAAQGHEHLIVCHICGQSDYFRGDDLSDLMGRVSRRSGFKIDDHWLQFFGLCQHCQG